MFEIKQRKREFENLEKKIFHRRFHEEGRRIGLGYAMWMTPILFDIPIPFACLAVPGAYLMTTGALRFGWNSGEYRTKMQREARKMGCKHAANKVNISEGMAVSFIDHLTLVYGPKGLDRDIIEDQPSQHQFMKQSLERQLNYKNRILGSEEDNPKKEKNPLFSDHGEAFSKMSSRLLHSPRFWIKGISLKKSWSRYVEDQQLDVAKYGLLDAVIRYGNQFYEETKRKGNYVKTVESDLEKCLTLTEEMKPISEELVLASEEVATIAKDEFCNVYPNVKFLAEGIPV